MPELAPYDSIIIGSGLSGLTCAILLARSGRRVLVLEQHSLPGPVARGFNRGGLYFDSGFHYVGGLGEGGAFRPLFRHLGLDTQLELFPFDEEGFDSLHISSTGETFLLPVGFSAIKAALVQRFPSSATGISHYLDEVASVWSHFPYLDLETDFADFGIGSVHGRSLKERLQEFSCEPQLQCLLSMHSLLYGVSPENASVTLNAQVAGSYYHSVHGITGGGRALVDALCGLLSAAGGEIRCSAAVTALCANAGAVSGVQLASGELLDAKEVVSTMNPRLLPQLLPTGVLSPAYRKRMVNLRQTPSAYIVFAKSRNPIDFLRYRNLFVYPRAELFDHDLQRPLAERGFYLAGADQGRDGGIEGLIGLVPASYAEVAEWGSAGMRRSGAYLEHKQSITEQLTMMFCKSHPELARLEVLDLATPLTLRDYSLAPEGSIYGVGRFLGQYNPHPATRLSGLFLSGQAVAAPGLLGTVVAGYLTCGTILGHESLRGEIQSCC